MSKTKTIFLCSNCDAQFSKWQGRCSECGKWGTIKEQITNSREKISLPKEIFSFSEIKDDSEKKRIKTNIKELDRVFGGGIVPGSLILIGGEPGIGKSTLSLQIAGAIKNSLYFSGEESGPQVKMRLKRLKIKNPDLKFSNEIITENIIALIKKLKPKITIIDSIQTIQSLDSENEAGSVSQIRTSTVKLLEIAKKNDSAVIIIGHITKDGQVAGPKTLEHLVDTVAYLEGDEKNDLRILRSKKNRFGAISEIGIFKMTENGLQEINNSVGIFLEKNLLDLPGMAIGSITEGTRTFLIEVQALVNKTVFGYPQRRTFGFNLNRLQILTAVLIKRANINLSNLDINLNIVGGIKSNDPALDLAVCLAIISAYKNKALNKDLIVIGEVGLGGEIRNVNHLEQRINEAKKLGFQKIIIPASAKIKDNNIELIKVNELNELIQKIF